METNTVRVLIEVRVKNQSQFERYLAGYKKSFEKYGGRTLYVSPNISVAKSKNPKPDIFVMQEWDNAAAYKLWANSEDYKPWKEIRDKSADVRILIAE